MRKRRYDNTNVQNIKIKEIHSKSKAKVHYPQQNTYYKEYQKKNFKAKLMISNGIRNCREELRKSKKKKLVILRDKYIMILRIHILHIIITLYIIYSYIFRYIYM